MTHSAILRPANGVANPFRLAASMLSAVWAFAVDRAEASPRVKAIRRLNALSDAELAAGGRTRAIEARRIFSDRHYTGVQ